MKFLFIRPNYYSHFITPPLGLGYLSAYLKQNGINTCIVDALKDNLSLKQIENIILNYKPEAVGITCLTAYFYEVVKISQMVKKNNIKCIIGGIHPTFLPYSTLKDSNADFVICGEAEIALTKLVKNNFINNNIQGVYSLDNIKNDDDPISTAEIVKDLDELPFPDWEQINPRTYPLAPHGGFVKNYPIGVVMSSRGCPYSCTFCASPGFSKRKIRHRSPGNVFSEIKFLVDKYKVKEIHFEDDNFTFKRQNVVDLCNLFIKNKLNITWSCPNGIRVDKIDEELLRLMLKSGCYYFSFGIESANTEILKNIKKHETIEQITNAINLADRIGIMCQGFFIFGLPGETIKSMEETINYVIDSKLCKIQVAILDVIPGSELWKYLGGQFKPNWNKKYFKEPEWIPEGLTKNILMEYQEKAFRRFYFRPKVFFRLLKYIKLKQIPYIFKILLDYRILKKRKKID